MIEQFNWTRIETLKGLLMSIFINPLQCLNPKSTFLAAQKRLELEESESVLGFSFIFVEQDEIEEGLM